MSKNYTKKYGSALKNAPNTEQGDILIEGRDKRLKKISPLEVKYNGSSFGLILDLYEGEKKQHSELKSNVQQACDTLTATLIEKGYNTPNVELNALIEDINKLHIILPNTKYKGYKLENGYCKGYGYDVIVEDSYDEPDDFDKGYWKIIDYEFVLDEELYELMWRSL